MNKLLGILLMTVVSCNIETNTSDPQASSTSAISKANKFFKTQYNIDSLSTCNVEEAWIEEAWKNEIKNGQVIKKGFSEDQLILRLKGKPAINGGYLVDWLLVDSTYGTFGSGNGVFILDLGNKANPEKFTIFLRMIKHPGKPLCKYI